MTINKTFFDIIATISNLSCVAILVSVLLNKERKGTSISYYLCGFVAIDLINYASNSYFVEKFHSNFLLNNLSVLFEAIFSMLIIHKAFKTSKYIAKTAIGIGVFTVLIFIINSYFTSFSLSKPIRIFSFSNTLIQSIFSIYLLIVVLSNRGLYKHKQSILFFLVGTYLYYSPSIIDDYFTEYHFSLKRDLNIFYIIDTTHCLANMIRNLLFSIYAYNHE